MNRLSLRFFFVRIGDSHGWNIMRLGGDIHSQTKHRRQHRVIDPLPCRPVMWISAITVPIYRLRIGCRLGWILLGGGHGGNLGWKMSSRSALLRQNICQRQEEMDWSSRRVSNNEMGGEVGSHCFIQCGDSRIDLWNVSFSSGCDRSTKGRRRPCMASFELGISRPSQER